MSTVARGGRWARFAGGRTAAARTSSQRGRGRSSGSGAPRSSCSNGQSNGNASSAPASNPRGQDNDAILCCLLERRQVVVACFEAVSCQIYISKIPAEDPEFSNVCRIIRAYNNPCVVLPASCSQKRAFTDALSDALGIPVNSDRTQLERSDEDGGNSGGHHQGPDQFEVQNSSSGRHAPRRRTAQSGRSSAHSSAFSQAPSGSTAAASNPESAIRSFSSHGTESQSGDFGMNVPNNSLFFYPNLMFSKSRTESQCSLVSFVGMPVGLTPPQRIAYLSHLFNGEVGYTRVVGALLAFLVHNALLSTLHGRNEHGVEMPNNDDIIVVSSISYRDYCDTLHISMTTMRSLNVFSDESHPMGRGGIRGKEGDSLFNMMKNHVKSKPGTQVLRSWLTHPSTSKSVIEARQFLVRRFMDPVNRALIVAVRDALRGLPNVRGLMMKFRTSLTDLSDWKGLFKACKSFKMLQETFRTAVRQDETLKQSDLIVKLLEVSGKDINDVLGWIYAGINFDDSKSTGRLIVEEGFNEEVDKLKTDYAGLDDFLSQVGRQEHAQITANENCPPLRWVQVILDTHLGFLVVLPNDAVERHHINTWMALGLEFVFHWEHLGFCFRNERTRQLDTDLGSIHIDIVELEKKTIQHLCGNVLEGEQALSEMADIICQLDVLQALAECALHNSWTVPTVSDDDNAELIVEDGWFPILENKVSSIVRNSIRMKIGDVHVVTGPNHSGKSIFLCQVAVTVILAQIGGGIPGKGVNNGAATVPIMKGINSRMGTYERVMSGYSSFFQDSCQVACALRREARRYLNVIDEYGKGTSTLGGMCLLTASIRSIHKHAVEQKSMSLFTTHMIEILTSRLCPLGDARFNVMSMQVVIRDGQTIKTFKVENGSIASESLALQCALEQQVDIDMMRRAAQVAAAVKQNVGMNLYENEAVVPPAFLAELMDGFETNEEQ